MRNLLFVALLMGCGETGTAGMDGGGIQSARGREWIPGRIELAVDAGADGGCADTVSVPSLDGSPLLCPDPRHTARIEHRGEHTVLRCLCPVSP